MASGVHHEVVPDLYRPNAKVEFFWKAPPTKGNYPVLILVHGHQGKLHSGAKMLVNNGALDLVSAHSFVAVAVSQAGYGETSGPLDHAGPASQSALRTVIRFFRTFPLAAPNKIILSGMSMGATLAATTATYEPDLAAVVLENGMYDMRAAMNFLRLRSYFSEDIAFLFNDLEGMTTGTYDERSAILRADKIKARVLLLAGLGDHIALPEQSLAFHEALLRAGGKSELVLYPFGNHKIPPEMKMPDIARLMWAVRQ